MKISLEIQTLSSYTNSNKNGKEPSKQKKSMESCGEGQKNTHKKRGLRFIILDLRIISFHIGLLESSPKLKPMVRMGLKCGPKYLIRWSLYRMDTVGRSTFVGVVLRQRIFYFCSVISRQVHLSHSLFCSYPIPSLSLQISMQRIG